MVGKVHESAAITGNLTSPHAPELKFPVIAATNVGLSRQPAQVAPPQLQGGGRAEEGEAKAIRRGRGSNVSGSKVVSRGSQKGRGKRNLPGGCTQNTLKSLRGSIVVVESRFVN